MKVLTRPSFEQYWAAVNMRGVPCGHFPSTFRADQVRRCDSCETLRVDTLAAWAADQVVKAAVAAAATTTDKSRDPIAPVAKPQQWAGPGDDAVFAFEKVTAVHVAAPVPVLNAPVSLTVEGPRATTLMNHARWATRQPHYTLGDWTEMMVMNECDYGCKIYAQRYAVVTVGGPRRARGDNRAPRMAIRFMLLHSTSYGCKHDVREIPVTVIEEERR